MAPSSVRHSPVSSPARSWGAPVVLVLLAVSLASCAAEGDPVRMDPSVSDTTIVYYDQEVARAPLQILVRPESDSPGPLGALVLPFRVTQDMDYRQELGIQMSRMVWQSWLASKVMPTLVLDNSFLPRNPAQAIQAAAARGLDLAVVGTLRQFMDGGTTGETSVALQIDIYDVKSGLMIWSMQHGGRMEPGRTRDWIVAKMRNRMPQDPVWAIVQVLARDMAQPVANWAQGS